MWRLTARNIASRKVRFLLTAFAITLGVAFMSGTLVLTDTIRTSNDAIEATANEGTDALVRSAREIGGDMTDEVRGGVPASVLATVRGVDGVDAVAPVVDGPAQIVGRDGELLDDNDEGAVPIGLAYAADPRLSPLDLVAGAAPVDANDVVIDKASAEDGRFEVGDQVRVLTKAGAAQYDVTGIVTYGGSDDAGSVVAFSPATASAVLGSQDRFDAIRVAAAEGTRDRELARAIDAALADQPLETLTGAELVDDAAETRSGDLEFMNTFLMTFAIVALIVGSFVIFNAFSITAAQRTRETALLRALGARRKQVMRSVMLESLVTGVVASAAGVGLGIVTASGLKVLLSGFGLDLPAAALVVEPRTLVISMIVGTVITLVAAYAPARKAAAVAPMAALREVALERAGASTRRTVFGTLVLGLGVALLALGLFGGAGIAAVAGGAGVVFLGMAVVGPVLSRPLASLLGAPLALRGITGKLARENARRNPKRTAATASALMVAVGLVAFITIFAASAQTSINRSIDAQMKSEYVIEPTFWDAGLSTDVADATRTAAGVTAVEEMRMVPVVIDGATKSAAAVDPQSFGALVDFDFEAGRLDTLGPNDIAISEKFAEDHDWKVGDQVEMTFAETGAQPFTVTGIYKYRNAGDVTMSLTAYDANVPDAVDNLLFVDTDGSVGARTAIEDALASHPDVNLMTRSEYKASVADELSQILNLVYALLALAIVIALFGIANTLALSIHERTRELGLLRAVGMGRAQVRAAVRWESVIIALLGTVLGIAIGVGFGWGVVNALAGEGIDQLALPAVPLGAIVVLAAFAGVGAAWLPARRAAKLDILPALQAQ